MKRKNAGAVTAKKQRKQAAAKARRARRNAKVTAAVMRKARGLLLRISQLEAQVRTLQASVAAVPEAAP